MFLKTHTGDDSRCAGVEEEEGAAGNESANFDDEDQKPSVTGTRTRTLRKSGSFITTDPRLKNWSFPALHLSGGIKIRTILESIKGEVH